MVVAVADLLVVRPDNEKMRTACLLVKTAIVAAVLGTEIGPAVSNAAKVLVLVAGIVFDNDETVAGFGVAVQVLGCDAEPAVFEVHSLFPSMG